MKAPREVWIEEQEAEMDDNWRANIFFPDAEKAVREEFVHRGLPMVRYVRADALRNIEWK